MVAALATASSHLALCASHMDHLELLHSFINAQALQESQQPQSVSTSKAQLHLCEGSLHPLLPAHLEVDGHVFVCISPGSAISPPFAANHAAQVVQDFLPSVWLHAVRVCVLCPGHCCCWHESGVSVPCKHAGSDY